MRERVKMDLDKLQVHEESKSLSSQYTGYSVKQIMPATNWFYLTHHKPPQPCICIYRLACWVLHSNDGIYGYISVNGAANQIFGGSEQLVLVPPTHGEYKHRDELTAKEWAAYKNGGFLKLNTTV